MRLPASLLCVALATPALASAQGIYLPPPPTREEIALDQAYELDDARALRDTGAGMALGGFITIGFGAALMYVPGGFENPPGFIAGGLAQGMGTLSLLIGLPMWIAGDVRTHILDAAGDERTQVAEDWELAGMATTLTGLALMLVGGGLMGLSLAMRDRGAQGPLLTTGGVMMPIGLVLATFIGPPMWGEGARF